MEHELPGNPALKTTLEAARLRNVRAFAALLDKLTAIPSGWKAEELTRDSGSEAILKVKDRSQLYAILQRFEAAGVITSDMTSTEKKALIIKPSPHSDGVPILTLDFDIQDGITLTFDHSALNNNPKYVQPFIAASIASEHRSFAAKAQDFSQSPLAAWARAVLAKENHSECLELLNDIMPANLPAKWTSSQNSSMQGGQYHGFSLKLPEKLLTQVLTEPNAAKVIDVNKPEQRSNIVAFPTPPYGRAFLTVSFDPDGNSAKIDIDTYFLTQENTQPFDGMAKYAQALSQKRAR